MKKKIRLGIFGLTRGSAFFPAIIKEGGEVVAVCEKNENRINQAKKNYDFSNVTIYDDVEKFIEHDMDAVLLCNYFCEHAEYAIRFLEKGIHVLSECQSNVTMAEGVALVRAAEKSNAKYVLLENYPFMLFNLEMKKLYEEGTLGKALYCEGEYNHPGKRDYWTTRWLYNSEKHWRRYLPRTYYLTHSLAPLMYITGARPKRVSAFPIFHPLETSHAMVGDIGSVMTTLNDDDSVFRFMGHTSFGGEENSYRFCCEKGQMENVRGTEGKIMLTYNEWEKPQDKEKTSFYMPDWSPEDKEIASQMGHFGGDYFVFKEFFAVIRGEKENVFDVYFATTLASTAILAHRSQLEKGVPYDIPDFRKEEDRKKWENDTLTPFWGKNGEEPSIPCCSRPDYRPTEQALEWFRNTMDGKNPDEN